jgi:DNA-binding NtrC family response regulator
MRVLIIGSLASELGGAARIAMARGARIDQADTMGEALLVLRGRAQFDLVIADIACGIAALIQGLAAERFAVPVIAASAVADEALVIAAIEAGARDYLPLPPDPDLIAAMLSAVAHHHHEGLIVGDPAMMAVLDRAQQVARSAASILITGESGTGKEVLALHIHRQSARADGPFIAINCAAIPEALLESELFGHEKGAFSGALARRIGKFEAAHGGTLLLDEIAEMDLRLQSKLLRVLQERVIDRVGGDRPVPVDVRIIAATNRNLLDDMTLGRFREDLFFRLGVITLKIPALRERPGDILPLARYFLDRYAEANKLGDKRLSAAAEGQLMRYGWRGNVRELQNIMHRAVLLSAGTLIDTADLELELAPASTTSLPNAPPLAGDTVTREITTLVGRRMEEVEQALILETLRHCLGNRTHAANILGISIRALRNKLRDYAAHGASVPSAGTGVAA